MQSKSKVHNILYECPSPLVTIALATFNVSKYLKESLDRITNQTYSNLEILCIDDASTDGTQAILQGYAKNDSRVNVIQKSKNEGLAVSRNTAMDIARGKYVCFVDGDDVMDLDLIEKAVYIAERDNADMVIWDYYEFGHNEYYHPQDNRKFPSALGKINVNNRHELVKLLAFTWIRLFKTQSLRELNVSFPVGRTKQDQPVHWASTTLLQNISILAERKYGYRISENQTSHKKGRELLDVFYVNEVTKKMLIEKEQYDEYKREFLHSRLSLFKMMCTSIKKEYQQEAKALVKSSLNTDEISALNQESFETRIFFNSLLGKPLNKLISKSLISIFFLIRSFHNSNKRLYAKIFQKKN